MLARCIASRCGSIIELGRPLLSATAQQTRLQHDGRPLEASAGQGWDSAASDLHEGTKHWYKDESITAGQGSKIVKQRLHSLGTQKVIHLTEVAKRVKTSEDAAMAMDIAQQFALRRANRQQHDGISPQTSYLVLKVAAEAAIAVQSIVKVGVDEAVEVLKRAPELKLTFGIGAFRDVIVRASKAGDLAAMRSAFQLLQAAGIRPSRDLGFCLIRACFDNRRPDLAVAYAREFEVNGVGLRPAMVQKVQEAEQELLRKRPAAKQARAAKAAGNVRQNEGEEHGVPGQAMDRE